MLRLSTSLGQQVNTPVPGLQPVKADTGPSHEVVADGGAVLYFESVRVLLLATACNKRTQMGGMRSGVVSGTEREAVVRCVT